MEAVVGTFRLPNEPITTLLRAVSCVSGEAGSQGHQALDERLDAHRG